MDIIEGKCNDDLSWDWRELEGTDLHFLSNGLSITENISQSHRAENIPQGGGGQQPGGPAVVVHVGDGVRGVGHLVVHDGVDEHRHTVLGQDLERG